MRAALCKSLDGPAGLVVADVAPPQAAPGEVLVQVSAVGLNFADTLITRGKYQYKPDLPFSPGAEIAGSVRALGADVSDVEIGARVMAYVNWGGAREIVAVPRGALVAVPDSVPDEIAAGVSVTYGTAMHGLIERGRLAAGETVVVTGAGGGAGQAAVEIAKLHEARVVAVVSSPEKIPIARDCGADEVVVAAEVDLKEAVRGLTNGRGADVVYDCVGGAAAESLIRALAWRGRFLVVGFAAGDIPKIPLNLLLLKGADAVGVFWGEAVRRDPTGHARAMRQALDWIADGRLRPKAPAIYPFADIAEALGVLDRRQSTGKVVVTL